MYYFSIDTFAVSASFRVPETHTFQQTLPLPPVTTLIGMVGAAVGLDFESALRFREENGLRLGVVGAHRGKARDLWKYQKIKSDEVLSAVLTREFLTYVNLVLVIGAEGESVIKEVRVHFLCPRYVLTAGNSDDLMKIIRVGEIKKAEEVPLFDFEATVLPGDHTANYESVIEPENIPLGREIHPPQAYFLPTAFTFQGTQRRVSERRHFTFIDTRIRLKEPVPGLMVGGKAVTLL
jgi:CRISPR-associated protein Cas5t